MTAPVITITRPGRLVPRRYTLDAELLSVEDDYGPLRGRTTFAPAAAWTPPDVMREAEERIAATVEPRRRRAKEGV